MIKDFISLIYPNLCYCCNNPLAKAESGICTFCSYHLPKTNFHQEKDNPVSKLFWGRVGLEAATSYYYFTKDSGVQSLIHQLKYKGKQEIGLLTGRFFGNDLINSPYFTSIDYLIPVPLHYNRLIKRGYNQSECIAKGMADSMNKELKNDVLFRNENNATQTNKSHYARWKNVEVIFKVSNEQKLESKHFLLVDDVLTTGSTLEACAIALLTIPDAKVSIATLAYTTG